MDFNFYNFYFRYRWKESDFLAFQTVLKNYASAIAKGFTGGSVLDGLKFSSASNFLVTLSKGAAIDVDGNPLIKDASEQVTFAGPSGGLGRKSIVVIRRTLTDNNLIQDPNNIANNVYLNTNHSSQLVVIDGTAAASPAYPTKLAGDVVLFGVIIGGADTQITSASIDYSVRESFGKSSTALDFVKKFDLIVGRSHEADYGSLSDALASSGISLANSILVKDSETVDSLITINKSDLKIEFDKGVVFTKGTAASGIVISASGVEFSGIKFKDFSSAGNVALGITGEKVSVHDCIFKNCLNEIVDQSSGLASILACFSEV